MTMCSKRLKFTQRGDWVAALHLSNHRHVDLHRYSDRERFWIARQLIEDHGWSVTRAGSALGFSAATFGEMEEQLMAGAS